MSALFEKLGAGLATVGVFISGLFGATPITEAPQVVPQAPQEETLGADTVLPVAGMTYYLSGTGISSSATTFSVTSLTITQNGKKIQDTDLSDIFYITLEPGSRARQEVISCTTVVQNADNTATFSGCTRGLSPVTPYTASTSLQFAHAGGSIAIFSNPPQLYNQVAIKDNDETITGSWLFPTPVAGSNPATKDFVTSVVTGGTISYDRIVVAGLAGETVATGTIVYLDKTASRWYKADNDLSSTYIDQTLGISQGNGTAGNNIQGGILTYGLDSTQKGMTGGNFIFLSGTAGATSTATTSQILGKAISATTMFFDQNLIDSSVYIPTTFTATTTFTGNVFVTGTSTGNGKVSVYVGTTSTSTAYYTWTKSSGTKLVEVIVFGGGGGGGGGAIDTSSTYSTGGYGGGGGGISRYMFTASQITATTSIIVGAGGLGGAGKSAGSQGNGADGNSGGTSSFGSYLSATGGGGGLNNTGFAGTGGTGLTFNGTTGGDGGKDGVADSTAGASATSFAATGGGGGCTYTQNTAGSNGGSQTAIFTASGGVGVTNGNGGNGSSSPMYVIGGTGGAGGGEVTGSGVVGRNGGNGGSYGGGGGGAGISIDTNYAGGNGGSGGGGAVIVIEY